MRKLITLFLIILSLDSLAQVSILPIDPSSGNVTYTEVIRVDSVSASELFSRSKLWFAKTYNSSKDVIQNTDNDNYSITGKAKIRTHARIMGERTWGYVSYIISIYCKNGRYKYVVSDFYHEGDAIATSSTLTPSVGQINRNTKESGGFGSYRKKDLDRLCEEINSNIKSLIVSLKNGMSKKSEAESKDW
ncbi:DUF4468 domain-containing protein [Flectobacillus major]|uniref:DUF4468 domain-containing protein n=1 Tax=Flectobacillus major TaxID=103 RepID=UPI00041E85AA|nr:DUF4468 domain-containing protein [Flectobacillus major]